MRWEVQSLPVVCVYAHVHVYNIHTNCVTCFKIKRLRNFCHISPQRRRLLIGVVYFLIFCSLFKSVTYSKLNPGSSSQYNVLHKHTCTAHAGYCNQWTIHQPSVVGYTCCRRLMRWSPSLCLDLRTSLREALREVLIAAVTGWDSNK